MNHNISSSEALLRPDLRMFAGAVHFLPRRKARSLFLPGFLAGVLAIVGLAFAAIAGGAP